MKVQRLKTISKRDINLVSKILSAEKLSGFNAGTGLGYNGGEQVLNLEKSFCKYFNIKHAIGVNSWTSGLEIAIKSFEFPKSSEIICSPWSMSATVAAISHAGHVPVFCDIDKFSLNIDPKLIEQKISSKTKAILLTDMYGQSCDIDSILKIAKKYNLRTISDTAQAIGSKYNGKFTGTHTDIGGFSFNWHKHLNCGEGGIVITNNSMLADRIRKLRNHSETVGYLFGHNYRMTEISAALIIQQLPSLKKRIQKRVKITTQLRNLLQKYTVHLPDIKKNSTHVYCSLPILFEKKSQRDYAYQLLKSLYPVRTSFSIGPLHLLKQFKMTGNSMPITESVPNLLLDLDMNYEYKIQHIKEIAKLIKQVL